MYSLYEKFLFFFATLYFASLVIFQGYFFNVVHILTAVLFVLVLVGVYTRGKRRIEVNEIVIVYALFSLFAIASSLWSIDFDVSFSRGSKLLYFSVTMVILYNLFKQFDMTRTFIYGMLLATLVNFLLLIGWIPVDVPLYADARAIGTTENANLLALFMFLSIFGSIWLLLDEERMPPVLYYYQYANIVMAYYIILLTASKKATVIAPLLFVAYLLIVFHTRKRLYRFWIVLMVGIVLAVQFVDMEKITKSPLVLEQRFNEFVTDLQRPSAAGFSSTTEREMLVKEAFAIFERNPFVGSGLDTVALQTLPKLYAHNNYAELLAGVGIAGFLLFYMIYYFLFRKIFRVTDADKRFILLTAAVSLLLYEIGMVTYSIKLFVFFLLFLSVLAEQERPEDAIEGTA